MKSPGYKVKVAIVGCGAIGTRMAKLMQKDLKKDCKITGLYDIEPFKAEKLAKQLRLKHINVNQSLSKMIKDCDCLVEAVNTGSAHKLIHKALTARKSVLSMSVGRLINSKNLFRLARKNKCYILLPSGAIAGLDAIKAAAQVHVEKITLVSKKPPEGFLNNPYLARKKIDLSKIKKETVLFEGGVDQALKYFPQNINVGATLALASRSKKKLKIRIITSPKFKKNIHEVEMVGDFGRIVTRTENEVCPDNPKTSYLAVLSGLQTLRQYCTGILVGT